MPFIDYSNAQPVPGASIDFGGSFDLPDLSAAQGATTSSDDVGRAGFEAGFAAAAAALGLPPSAGAAVGGWLYDNLPQAHGIEGITDPSAFAQDWQEAVRQLSARKAAAQSPADWTQLVRDVSWWLTILMAEQVGVVYSRQPWEWDATSRGPAGVWHAPKNYEPRKPGSGVNPYQFADVRNDDRFASLRSPEWQAAAKLAAQQLGSILAQARSHVSTTGIRSRAFAALPPALWNMRGAARRDAEHVARLALRDARDVLAHAAVNVRVAQLVAQLQRDARINVPAARATQLLQIAANVPADAWPYI